MKERMNLIKLYDIYGELFTDKQRETFEDYYFNNLTLSEISENNEISRSAVQKTLKEIETKLNYYESKLSLLNKFNLVYSKLEGTKYIDTIKEILG